MVHKVCKWLHFKPQPHSSRALYGTPGNSPKTFALYHPNLTLSKIFGVLAIFYLLVQTHPPTFSPAPCSVVLGGWPTDFPGHVASGGLDKQKIGGHGTMRWECVFTLLPPPPGHLWLSACLPKCYQLLSDWICTNSSLDFWWNFPFLQSRKR